MASIQLKIIKDEQEHAQALARLESLLDRDPAEGSPEHDELDVLALLIERYEEEQFPMNLPSPVDAIRFRMDQQGLKNKDLVPYLGSASRVSEILKGRRPLSLSMIRALSDGLDIPADVLIQEPSRKQQYAQETDWLAFPLAEMRKRGYFPDFEGSLRELKEYATEVVGGFLGRVNLSLEASGMMMRTTAHLRENDKETDPYAVLAWQARILHLAHGHPPLPDYVPGIVGKDWIRELARLSWSQQGPALAIEFLNNHGIYVVFEKHLPKTYLDGAVSLNESGHPIVALTLRHDRVDNFWFTLMHELAHLALHVEGSESWYLDNLDAASNDPREDQADALAAEVLIPTESIRGRLPESVSGVEALARSLNISPCIVAGRVRREQGNYQLFGKAFRSDGQVSKVLKAAGYLCT